jgi:hypothetical protein
MRPTPLTAGPTTVKSSRSSLPMLPYNISPTYSPRYVCGYLSLVKGNSAARFESGG